MQLNRSVIIGLLARDCKDSIVRNKPRIEKFCSFFEDYHIVVVENDSNDGTQEVLRDWAEENNRMVVDSFTDHSERRADSGYDRISYMAWLRNRPLDDIRQLPAPDVVVMMDVDLYDFDVEGLLDSICRAPEDWGALTANGRMMLPNHRYLKAQFDQYAYLANDEDLCDMNYGMFTTRHLYRRGRELNEAVQMYDYYPVHSAFGGVAVYRYEAIKDLTYQTLMIDDHHPKAFCEHVPFHLDIIQRGYQNYVCRAMVVNNGILEVKPWVAFLIELFPRVHATICDFSKWMHGYE